MNENWCLYKEKLIELAHAHIPKVSFRVNSSKHWFSKALRTLKNKKKRLYRTAKRVDTPVSWSKHKSCDAAYYNALSQAKQKYFSCDLQSLLQNNPKKFWKTISPAKDSDISQLLDSSGLPIARELSASIFNNYFTAVFTKEDHSKIPTPIEL